jgi:hypothetical protein
MKNPVTAALTGSLLVWALFTACEKKNDDFTSNLVNEYMHLQPGKYIRYILDSTRYVDFGQRDTVISYQAKDVVEDTFTDGANRTSYRVVRYLRDVNSTNEEDWTPNIIYSVTPFREAIEVNEENFRFIKLSLPILEGRSWRGNGYLPANPYKDLYEFSNDEDMGTWEYTYQDVGATLNLNNTNYEHTISVLQIADSVNVGVPNAAASKSYWVEKYARNIGLVYKEVVMWEYQPPNPPTTQGYKHGFGIRMTILDHN